MRRINKDRNDNDGRFTNTVSSNGNNNGNESYNNNNPRNRRVREITCQEAARAVYDLSREGQSLLEESKQLQIYAEKLIEEAFLLAEAIERSCYDDCW